MSNIRRGAEAHQLWSAAETQHRQIRDEIDNGIRRFWMREGEEAIITFLDGDLMPNGLLNCVCVHEHEWKPAGQKRRQYFQHLEREECPLCVDGNDKYFVSGFTIVDHRVIQLRTGQTVQNEKKLYPAKRETLNNLQRLATTRGGLAGCTFKVWRSSQRSARVGDQFEFLSKNDLATIAQACGLQDVQPVDYDKAFPYYDRNTLAQMGFGQSASAAVVAGHPPAAPTGIPPAAPPAAPPPPTAPGTAVYPPPAAPPASGAYPPSSAAPPAAPPAPPAAPGYPPAGGQPAPEAPGGAGDLAKLLGGG